mgnify:CR=1 FL=1
MLTRLLLKPLIVAVTVVAPATASPLPPLEENARVKSEFLSAAVGDEIRKNCPSISARMFRALGRVNALQDYALGLGYSKADIKAMREDPAAKANLRAMRDAYMAKHGVRPGDSDSYCRLGREEIEKNSLTGWLLRAN